LDADPRAISELSLQLLERLAEARKLQEQGETQLASRGLAIPGKLVDYLIGAMLDALSWKDAMENMHRDLIVLIRERLGGSNQHHKQVLDIYEKRAYAKWIGARLKASGVEPSFRRVAELLGVSASSILRWFPDNSFQEEVERLSRAFDHDGNPIIPSGLKHSSAGGPHAGVFYTPAAPPQT
jgi:hypothetical protein